ncbi:unnamed protein product, partial [Dicrocoelium dendriticum]
MFNGLLLPASSQATPGQIGANPPKPTCVWLWSQLYPTTVTKHIYFVLVFPRLRVMAVKQILICLCNHIPELDLLPTA